MLVSVCMQEVLEMDVQPYTMTASLKCNRSKNRYIDILASKPQLARFREVWYYIHCR